MDLLVSHIMRIHIAAIPPVYTYSTGHLLYEYESKKQENWPRLNFLLGVNDILHCLQ